MKASFATTALILAAASCLAWRDHQEFIATRNRNVELLTEAAALGITPDPQHPRGKVFVNPQRETRAKLTSVEYIAFIKEMKAKTKTAESATESRQEIMNRYEAFMERVSALDEGELKRLVFDLQSSPELDDESRKRALSIALSTLSNHYPQTALRLLTGSEAFGIQGITLQHLASSALSNWAKSDPVAAVKWVKENGEKASDLVNDSLKCSLLSSAASQDPKLSFQLIGELKFKDTEEAFSAIVRAAKTSEERTATLNALRAFTSTLEDSKARTAALDQSMSSFASDVAPNGIDRAVAWFDSAKLSPAELQGFSRGLSTYSIKSAETGQWVEWMGKTLPADQASKQISSLVDEWTEKDYQAAGTWLTQAPDGPTKQAAVRGYVEAIASYEPETAEQWAMTLPPGKERDGSLRKIYQKWPTKDPADKAAAEAFADQHGIKR